MTRRRLVVRPYLFALLLAFGALAPLASIALTPSATPTVVADGGEEHADGG